KSVTSARKQLRREIRAERFEGSFLGVLGRAIEPVTQYAGFNWRINIALLSAFAAKENSAATLGAIYGHDGTNQSVEVSMREGEVGFTPLHALALMLFMALYPPCIPTSIMVRHQSNSTKWMLFSIGYQSLLGLFVATLVFTGGSLLGLSGMQAMWAFYALCVATTLVMAMIPIGEESRPISVAGEKLCKDNCS
ncbi:MAG: ferrous iron transport protein B, partial [Proteobacteria bacterium]|nr:ferrous iron transport protein B [Pseudomonadota bacterium]